MAFIDRDGKKGIFQTNNCILGPTGVIPGPSGISFLVWFDLKRLKTISSSQESTDSPQHEQFYRNTESTAVEAPSQPLRKGKELGDPVYDPFKHLEN